MLPDHLLPFLRHAISLLTTYGDNLLVRPTEDDAPRRIEFVRDLLKRCEGLQDPASVLQCPLSDEVVTVWCMRVGVCVCVRARKFVCV